MSNSINVNTDIDIQNLSENISNLTKNLGERLFDSIYSEEINSFDSGDNLNNLNNSNNSNTPTTDQNIENFICDICGDVSKNAIELLDHKLIFHDNSIEYDQYICDECENTFTTENDLNEHYQREHENVHYCMYCNNFYYDELDLNNHIDNAHNKEYNIHDNNEGNIEDTDIDDDIDNENDYGYYTMIEEDLYRCNQCYDETDNLEEMKEHLINIHNIHLNENESNRQNDVHSRYARNYGNIECPICFQRFTTQAYLGEHFTEDHQSYELQSTLDNLIPKTSFCGFEVLEHINSVYVYRPTYRPTLKKMEKSVCDICCFEYEINDLIKNGKDLDENDNIEHHPILMLCCEKKVCNYCFKNSSKLGNNLICIFCKHDHSIQKSDEKFIKIIEPSVYDTKNWIEWWKNKVDILAFGLTK